MAKGITTFTKPMRVAFIRHSLSNGTVVHAETARADDANDVVRAAAYVTGYDQCDVTAGGRMVSIDTGNGAVRGYPLSMPWLSEMQGKHGDPITIATLPDSLAHDLDRADMVLLMNTAIMPVSGTYEMTLIDIKTFSAAAAYAWHLCPVESHVGYESAQMLFKEVAGFWPEYNREGIREAFERYDKIMVVGCRLNYRFSDPKYKAVVGRQTPTLSDYEFFVVKKL